MMQINPLRNERRVYCAGPLFNEAERREMELIADVLRAADFEPFLPHSDGMEFSKVRPALLAEGYEPDLVGQTLHEAIFAMDVYQVVVGCGALVFNMNGRVPDEGAVAEATMAWMLGKPLVIFKEDVRSNIAGRDNPLLVGQTRFQTVSRIEDLPAALAERALDRHGNPTSFTCPAHLADVLVRGQALCAKIEELDGHSSLEIAELVWDLFGPARTATV